MRYRGFQDTCLGLTMAFDIQCGEFIQILHDGHGHWLTISSIGASKEVTEIFVYDSTYPSIGTYTKKLIAALVSSQEKKIVIKMMNVQLQAGGCDCGLFAIAFATGLANGIQPGECSFKLDAMRRHKSVIVLALDSFVEDRTAGHPPANYGSTIHACTSWY